MTGGPNDGVLRVSDVDLRVVDGCWEAGIAARAEVERHWQARLAERPRMFNGRVFVLTRLDCTPERVSATFIETDFMTFLAWRDGVFVDEGVRDGFVFGLLKDATGGVVLGRQAQGHLNAGFAYPPAGFIDAADVGPDGRIDVEGSIRRELAEEMGLTAADVVRGEGHLVVLCGPIVAFGVPFRAKLEAAPLLDHIRGHIATEAVPELEDVVVVRSLDEVARIAMTPHAELAVRHVIASDTGST